jgi:CspA family cold shock protein
MPCKNTVEASKFLGFSWAGRDFGIEGQARLPYADLAWAAAQHRASFQRTVYLVRPPKNDRQRQNRRRGFDDDHFFGNPPPPPPSFSGFGSPSSAPEAKATVKWYNSEKGYGFVEMADGSGDVFLHANSLQNAGFQAVTPGAILQIRVGQGHKGRQVDQVVSVTEGTAPPPRAAGGGFGDRDRDRGGAGGFDRPRAPRPPRAAASGPAVETTGIVKWYNATKGFGFISPQSGGKDVFVHATALETAGLQPLQEGQSVRISVVQGSKGPEVSTISLD